MIHKAVCVTLIAAGVTLAACEPKRVVTNLPPPAERLVCVAAGARPTIPSEYQVDWQRVRTVAEARAEHEAFVRSVRAREGVIARYIVDTESKLFLCANNAAWLRDYFKATAR